MNNATLIADGFTILASIFISGMNWQKVKSDLQSMKERLSRIEGMFEMKLKE